MHSLIKEIRAIAQTGLHYVKDPFDRERYQRLEAISHELYAMYSDADIATIEKFFFPENGYATPKVDLRCCVIKNDNVLLVKEKSDGKWTMPGGWADQNEAPLEGVIREVEEEAGYKVKNCRLYAIKDRDRNPYSPKFPYTIYKLFFVAEAVEGDFSENTEISEIGFFSPDDLPELSIDRVLYEDIEAGFRAFNQSTIKVHVD
ncbi:NUDIX hydrolase [Vibrio hannami]|uniref:NUDIX hydrolase n=1 Tax=Vibrio hannami TaxID=2717094 RepID=UPI00240EA750|nr:NUDIX hydrolase [Vibrio hannami]MDG3084628.1 NUDIX hydrolase [Vibrio hannami]